MSNKIQSTFYQKSLNCLQNNKNTDSNLNELQNISKPRFILDRLQIDSPSTEPERLSHRILLLDAPKEPGNTTGVWKALDTSLYLYKSSRIGLSMLRELTRALTSCIPFLFWFVWADWQWSFKSGEKSQAEKDWEDRSIALLGDRVECMCMKFISWHRAVKFYEVRLKVQRCPLSSVCDSHSDVELFDHLVLITAGHVCS